MTNSIQQTEDRQPQQERQIPKSESEQDTPTAFPPRRPHSKLVIGFVVVLVLFALIYAGILYFSPASDDFICPTVYKEYLPDQYKIGLVLVNKTLDCTGKRELDFGVKIQSESASRNFYAFPNQNPSLKIWIEKINPGDYQKYLDYIEESPDFLLKISSPAYSKKNKFTYKDHTYYTLFVYQPDMQSGFIMGATYILFPKINMVVTTILFNEKSETNTKLLSEDEVHSMIKELIELKQSVGVQDKKEKQTEIEYGPLAQKILAPCQQKDPVDCTDNINKNASVVFVITEEGTPRSNIEKIFEEQNVSIVEIFDSVSVRGDFNVQIKSYPPRVNAYQIELQELDQEDPWGAYGIFTRINKIEKNKGVIDMFWVENYGPNDKEKQTLTNLYSYEKDNSQYVLLNRKDGDTINILRINLTTNTTESIYTSQDTAMLVLPIRFSSGQHVIIFDNEKKQIVFVNTETGGIVKQTDIFFPNDGYSFTKSIFSPEKAMLAFSVRPSYFSEKIGKKSYIYTIDLETLKEKLLKIVNSDRFVTRWTLDNLVYLGSNAPKGCANYPNIEYINLDTGELTKTEKASKGYVNSPSGENAVLYFDNENGMHFPVMCDIASIGKISVRDYGNVVMEVEKVPDNSSIAFQGWTQDSNGFVYSKILYESSPNNKSLGKSILSKYVYYNVGSGNKIEFNSEEEVALFLDKKIISKKLNIEMGSGAQMILRGSILEYIRTRALFVNNILIDSIVSTDLDMRYESVADWKEKTFLETP